jgi:hypothetical protein
MDVSVVIFLRSNPRKAGNYLRIAFHGTVVRSGSGSFAVAFAEMGQAAGLGGASGPEMPAPGIRLDVSKRPDRDGI